MGRRKVKGKKYNGVYEYYKDSDKDKVTKSYYIQYKDENNVTRTKKCDARNKEEALDCLNAKKSEIRKEKKRIDQLKDRTELQKRNQALPLDQYAEIFHSIRENKSAKDEKLIYKNHISPHLGKKKLTKLTRKDIIEFRKMLEQKKVIVPKVIKNFDTGEKESINVEKNLSPKTIKNVLDYLRVILNNAVDDRYTESSPLDFTYFKDRNRRLLEKKKLYGENVTTNNLDKETGRTLLDHELDTLWELDELVANERLYLFLKACYYTGARPNGVMHIKVGDIDFHSRKIKIQPMKKASAYWARVPDMLLDLFQQRIEQYNLSLHNYIFFPAQAFCRAKSEEDKQRAKNKAANYSGYRKALQKIFDPVFNVGIDPYDYTKRVNVYSMRRTAATKVYKKHGIVHAKEFLHHSDIQTTMHYLNITNDMEVIDYGL